MADIDLRVRLDARAAETGSRRLSQSFDDAGRAARRQATGVDLLDSSVRRLGAYLSAGAIFAVLRSGVREAAAFSKSIAEVSTLLDDTGGLKRVREEVAALSVEFASTPVEQAKALYQIISAGATDAAEATQLLTAANKLAVGGVTDVSIAADGLTSILNAYGKSAGEATDISDALFVAVRAGKTTVDELSSSVGRVAPLAAQAGVSIDELLASVAALTKGGISTRESVTGVRAILAAVIRPTAEAQQTARALGIEFNAAALEAKGLAGFLRNVVTATGGSTEQLSKLFTGVEALVPALALAGQAGDDLSVILEDMEQKAGQTEQAFRRISEDESFKLERGAAAAREALRQLGAVVLTELAPSFEFAADNMSDIVRLLGDIVRLGNPASGVIANLLNQIPAPGFGERIFGDLDEILEEGGRRFAALGDVFAPPAPGITTDLPTLGGTPIELSEEAKKAVAALKGLTAEFEQFQRVRAAAAGFGFIAPPGVVASEINELAKLRGGIEQVEAALRIVPAAAPEFAQLTAVLEHLNEQMGQLEKGIAKALGDLPARLASLDQIAPKLAPIGQVTTQISAVSAALGTLELRAEAVQRAEEALFLARARQDPTRIAAAEDQLKDAREQLRDVTASLIPVIERSSLSAEKQRQVVEQLRETLLGAGIDMDSLSASSTSMAKALSIIESSGRGILAAADSVGAIGDNARRSLTGVLDLLRGLQQLEQAKVATGIESTLGLISGAGAILGGLASIGSALFGGDPERDRAVQANTRALQDLSLDLRGFRADTSENLFRVLNALEAGIAGGGNFFETGFSILRELQRAGLTNADLRAVAEEQGLDVFNDKGQLRLDQVGAFIEALKIATQGLVGFRDTLADAQLERELRNRLLGVEGTSQQQLQGLFSDVARFAPDLFQQFLNGIDPSDTDAVRGALTGMLDAFARGGVEFAELMGNLTRDEFLRWLDSATGALEATTQALVGFRDTLADAQLERSLRDRILGVERTGQQQLEALFSDVARFAPDLFRQFLGGVNTSDADAVRAALGNMLDAFATGGDAFAELMGGLTRDDFLGWLSSAAGALEKLDETINATTDAIRNVPSWFRVQAAVFNAARPDPFEPVLPPPPPRGPVTPPDRIGGPRPGRPNPGGGGGIVNPGQITMNIIQQPGESSEALANRVVTELERRNLARTGRRHGTFTL